MYHSFLGAPFCVQFPVLFDLCQSQDCTVKDASDAGFAIPFRRNLSGILLSQWNEIIDKVSTLIISSSPDSVQWGLGKNKIFSTRSMYTWLEKNLAGSSNKWIWRSRLPLKIKIFMWQLCRDAVLTGENMRKRNRLGSPLCSFCNQVQTNSHIFFSCSISKVVWGVLGVALGSNCVPNSFWQAMTWLHSFAPGEDRFYVVLIAAVCWAIWKVRNKITFDKHIMRSPNAIVFFVISLLRYWAGLQKDADKECLAGGADKLMRAASAVFAHRPPADGPRQVLMITGA